MVLGIRQRVSYVVGRHYTSGANIPSPGVSLSSVIQKPEATLGMCEGHCIKKKNLSFTMAQNCITDFAIVFESDFRSFASGEVLLLQLFGYEAGRSRVRSLPGLQHEFGANLRK